MSSKRMSEAACDPAWCPIEVALEVIGGMWKVIIVRELLQGTRRYSQLHRALKRVTHKMLTQQLRELERDGIVTRKVYPQVPPKVEYSLTDLGRSLDPLLDTLQAWGQRVITAAVRAGDHGVSIQRIRSRTLGVRDRTGRSTGRSAQRVV